MAELFRGSSKPFVRWWWLSGPFIQADISRQLQWVRDQGFGGVELAWLYPGWLEEEGDDSLRPEWLGPEWRELISFTKREAESLGLGCDFTFGSCWPFGGTWVTAEDSLHTFAGPAAQRIRNTWQEPKECRVVDHLSAAALENYAQPLAGALEDALRGDRSALFCDSLEISTEGLWSGRLWSEFEHRFGYSLQPFAEELQAHPDVRYDYRQLISATIGREFYAQFTAICHRLGASSRVQCHGAPTDLLQAYANVDIPESEALLFPPSFSRIAASAAAWAGKTVVSVESFTCIHGFPGWDQSAEDTWKREDARDLKLLADALFANGANQIIWHGMPYQPSGKQVEFYAAVHIGPDSPFVSQLPALNAYLESVSTILKEGSPVGGLGIYLPFEDALMRDRLPEDGRTPGANYYWEMRSAVPPEETEGFHPLWISLPFLKEAIVQEEGCIRSRGLLLDGIYVDCEWLDAASLFELERLALAGGALIWKQACREPGRKPCGSYEARLQAILSRARRRLADVRLQPLLSGSDLPPYWARRLGDDLLLFFAHPKAKEIGYPMPHLFSLESRDEVREVTLHWEKRETLLRLQFEPHQSQALLVTPTGAVQRVGARWDST